MFLIINFVKEHNKNFYKTMFATLNLFLKRESYLPFLALNAFLKRESYLPFLALNASIFLYLARLFWNHTCILATFKFNLLLKFIRVVESG